MQLGLSIMKMAIRMLKIARAVSVCPRDPRISSLKRSLQGIENFFAETSFLRKCHSILSVSSRGQGHSILHLRNLAGIDATVVDPQGIKLLKAGIDLLMHRGILRGDLAEILEQALTALVVVPFSVL